jgi:hypothetical protein
MKKATFAIITILALCLGGVGLMTENAAAINANAGTSSFSFLKINVGARPVAMGGAYTGLANDESSLYYNPAGIASMENKGIMLDYLNYFTDIQSGYVGYVRPLGFGSGKVIAFHMSYLNYGDFTETDVAGNTTGSFSGGDMYLAGTFAMKKGYYWSFGATSKFIYEKVQSFSATGIAFDLGARYTGPRDHYSFGLAVQNLGVQLSALGTEKSKLPLTVRGGAAYHLKGLPILLSSDLILPIDNDIVFAIGGEYYDLKPFYIRVGWNSFGSNYRASGSSDSWAGTSLGVGFDFRKMQISYAFSPGADLGTSHRITLTGEI